MKTDMDLNITYLNKAGSDQTGYDSDKVTQGLSFRQLLQGEDLKLLEKIC